MFCYRFGLEIVLVLCSFCVVFCVCCCFGFRDWCVMCFRVVVFVWFVSLLCLCCCFCVCVVFGIVLFVLCCACVVLLLVCSCVVLLFGVCTCFV